jgi:sec-independent protein translocase protein TatA
MALPGLNPDRAAKLQLWDNPMGCPINHSERILSMDIGIPELLIVLVIILLIFGPGRIAKIAGELGSGIRKFREGFSSSESEKEKKSSES